MDYFDASAAAGAAPSTEQFLQGLVARTTEDDLQAALDTLEDALSVSEDVFEPCPPAAVALLEQITSAPDARLTYASLGRRVADGMLTWDTFWNAPAEQPDGVHLVLAVSARMTDGMREFIDATPPPGSGGSGPGTARRT